ncbi:unnamed protein product, partial [Mesorhabditis spiculigera]
MRLLLAGWLLGLVGSSFIEGDCALGNCLNGGICHAGAEKKTYWCQCPSPYSGPRCDEQPCLPYCQHGGKCVSQNGTHACQCPLGFTGISCQTVVPSACTERPCSKHGTCKLTTSIYDFECECETGYTGHDCSRRTKCYCENGGRCVFNGFSAKCSCPRGFTGEHCEEDIDECLDNPCAHGVCENTLGGYQCICEDGWTGKACTHRTRHGECSTTGPASCRNGGFCHKHNGYYGCTCPPAFTGPFCAKDVNECENSPCKNGGSCVNSFGSFQCFCPADFTGDRCQIPVDSCENNKCSLGSTCIPDGNSYKCQCPKGRIGLFCELEDQCIRRPCLNGKCESDPFTGDYKCQCPAGFTGADCGDDIDECEEMKPCLHGATCINLQGSHKCECAPGYKGDTCDQFIEECSPNPCKNGGTCYQNNTCWCPLGFGGRLCESVMPDACENCGVGQDCLPDQNGDFSCQCPAGRSGRECEEILGWNPCHLNRCENGATCQNNATKLNGYKCYCALGWEGDYCQDATDFCRPNPCQHGGRCLNSFEGPKCACTNGFSGHRCEHLNDSCAADYCLNNGICSIHLVEGLKCQCPIGFSGPRCQSLDCEQRGCENDGVCLAEGQASKCHCPEGYTGPFCESRADECVASTCLNNGSCNKKGTCNCKRGFFGNSCQYWADIDKYNETELEEKQHCQRHKCQKLAENGVCDPECNFFACDYDGGDCSAKDKPYSKCLAANFCARSFHDGTCNEACNNEACLFDGFDCTRAKNSCPVSCRARSQDGHCDMPCNIEECGYDGGDCEKKSDTLPGELEIVILMEPEVFVKGIRDLLVDVSALLRATVRVANDSEGPRAYRWTMEGGAGQRLKFPSSEPLAAFYEPSPRHKRSLVSGVKVYFDVDVASCSHSCFSDPAAVASFVSAAVANKQLSMPIYSAVAVDRNAKPQAQNSFWTVLLGILAFIGVAFIGLVGKYQVIPHVKDRSRKRVINAHVWTPPTEETLNEQNEKGSLMLRWSGDYRPYHYGNIACARAFFDSSQAEHKDAWYPKVKIPKIEPANYGHPTGLHIEAYENQGTISQINHAEINAKTHHAQTALHLLVANLTRSDADVVHNVEQLVRNGAQINALDDDDMSPLFVAVLRNRTKVAEKLLSMGADPEISSRDGTTVLHQAAKNSDITTLKMLLRKQSLKKIVDVVDDNNRTPLMVLAQYHLLDDGMGKMLLDAGANINSQGDKERTDQTGMSPLHFAAMANNTAMIKFLVENDANKDAQDREERTALFVAAEKNHVEAVRLLVELGASTEIADQKERTPLYVAKECDSADVIPILLQACVTTPRPPPEKQPLSAPIKMQRARRVITKEPARKSRSSHPDTPPSSDRSDYSSPSPIDGTGKAMNKAYCHGPDPKRQCLSTTTLPSLTLGASQSSSSSPPQAVSMPSSHEAVNHLTPPQSSWNPSPLPVHMGQPDYSKAISPVQQMSGLPWNHSPPYDFHGVSIEYPNSLYNPDPFAPQPQYQDPLHHPYYAPSMWQTNV